jgi:hypothetical protein
MLGASQVLNWSLWKAAPHRQAQRGSTSGGGEPRPFPMPLTAALFHSTSARAFSPVPGTHGDRFRPASFPEPTWISPLRREQDPG